MQNTNTTVIGNTTPIYIYATCLAVVFASVMPGALSSAVMFAAGVVLAIFAALYAIGGWVVCGAGGTEEDGEEEDGEEEDGGIAHSHSYRFVFNRMDVILLALFSLVATLYGVVFGLLVLIPALVTFYATRGVTNLYSGLVYTHIRTTHIVE